ncbi:MAG: O-antigen ligase family protein [Cyanobacteria bacterium P01_D01_bin.156]
MSLPASESPLTAPVSPGTANGNLIGLLTVGFYVLFTLLPSSHSLMVSWPWVAVWQVTLMLPIIWLLWQLWFKPLSAFKLGSGLDWPMALLVIGLGVSTLFAEFPNQAIWYSWAALGGIAAMYALSGWVKTPKQTILLLKFQAVLGVAFILVSLGLWLSRTYFPELERLAGLEPYGVSQQFNFGVTSLRNWYPLGHQNYVAGYLVLILPLLFGLAVIEKSWQRWLWIAGCGLGLIDLYTASSRGGLLALIVTIAIALTITLFRSSLPHRLVLPTGSLMLCALVAITLANGRVRRPLLALLQGKTNNSELGYRIITNTIGWHMGLDHPLTGVGPGGVFQLYQKYRPYWAGREAELHFQLHSTPAQLWAELGIWGVGAMITLISLLVWRTWGWSQQRKTESFIPPVLVWSLLASLLAYGLMGLTDYQLDTPAISGVLIINFVILARVFQSPSTRGHIPAKRVLSYLRVCSGLGLMLVITLWLVPIHRAWALSKQGFDQLELGNFDNFETALTQAHQLAPWEPYYPSMLAWTLGDFSFQVSGESSARLRENAITWFQKANEIAPYQEFGQSNLGWLLTQTSPHDAVRVFTNSAALIPAKQGVFLGLGLSLLRSEQPSLAIEALVIELLRFPTVLTSPIWQLGELDTVKEDVFKELEKVYVTDIQSLKTTDPLLRAHIERQRGALHWWQGSYSKAAEDWHNFPTGEIVLQLAQGKRLQLSDIPKNMTGNQAFLAWLQPEKRQVLLEQLLIEPRNDLPQFNIALPTSEQVDQFARTMRQATSFDDWLKNSGLILQPRSERIGFGILNRHIDGPFPIDYAPQIVNQPVRATLTTLFSTPTFFPELERFLQPRRQRLISKLESSNTT